MLAVMVRFDSIILSSTKKLRESTYATILKIRACIRFEFSMYWSVSQAVLKESDVINI